MFLLDTNVVSEAQKPVGNAGVQRWLASVASDDLFVSVLVLGEIHQGIERLRRRDKDRAQRYASWLEQLSADYGKRVLPVTKDVAAAWGRLNVPDALPVVDGLMAATALVHGMTFVTRNIDHVSRSGARLLNPFEGA